MGRRTATLVLVMLAAAAGWDGAASGRLLVAADVPTLPDQPDDKAPAEPVEPAEKPAAERIAVPDEATRKKDEAAVKEVFGAQFAAAKTAAEKVKLAEEMLLYAVNDKNQTERYALLKSAETLAVGAGDLPTTLKIVDELTRTFQVDAEPAKRAALLAAAKTATTPAQYAEIAKCGSELIDQAMADDHFDVVAEIGSTALKAARESGNNDLVKRLTRRGKQLQKIRQEFAQLGPQRAALEKNPLDPQANLALGKFYCFVKQDWETGLAMLVQGNDPALKAAAEKDFAEPEDVDAVMAVADQWWKLAEGLQNDAQEAVRGRALKWYRQALPTLTGLTRARVEKRLKDHAELAGGETTTPATKSPATSTGSKTPKTKPAEQYALLVHVGKMVKEKRVTQSRELGFAGGRDPFTCAPDAGGLLVGFNLSVGTMNRITAIQPIFLTAKGQVNGVVFGQPTPKSVQIVAKKGYAVGSMTMYSNFGIDGLGMTFMKIEGGGLNAKTSYTSAWFGAGTNGTELSGNGAPVVGVFGHADNRRVNGLGLMLAEKP